MSETSTPGRGLRVLRAPETLLDEPGARLSHGGVLDTPSGLFTVLALERRPGPPRPAGSVSPWLVYLTEPGRRDALLALPGLFGDAEHGVQFTVCSFGPVRDPGRLVMAVHHPDLPRSLGVFLDSPVTPSSSAAWLVEPAVLPPPAPQPVQVWHTGLLRIRNLLFTHLEATPDSPGTAGGPGTPDLVDDPAWDLSSRRPEGTPRPLQAGFPDGAHHRRGAASAGPGHSSYDGILSAPDSPALFTWTCHPCGTTAEQSVRPR
ncbi:hypothetical protein ACFVYP_23455 [Kitasatospora sp. NPDC058201]|uniref:hypothetical protein n=1 Tax=unclassified Kitasatospora TaxID=2633591 RepID=UPI00364E3A31